MFERKLLNLVWIYLNVQVLEPIFWREAGLYWSLELPWVRSSAQWCRLQYSWLQV